MLELVIKKLDHTKVLVDGTAYSAAASNELADRYLIPCDDGVLHTLQIIHYVGEQDDNVFSVIGTSPTPAKSLLHEMNSMTTNSGYCNLTLEIIADPNSKMSCEVRKVCSVDACWTTSFCQIGVEESRGVRVFDHSTSLYPSDKTKRNLTIVKTSTSIIRFALYTTLVLVLGFALMRNVVTIFLGVLTLALALPLGTLTFLFMMHRTMGNMAGPDHNKTKTKTTRRRK